MIPVYTPAISVLLTRITNRTQTASPNYASSFDTIDLTPFLGSAGAVTTMKAIDQPCGAFSITFADRLHAEYGDTVSALAEPMDVIEIRMSRTPENYQGEKLPLVMRGFVTTISRDETIAQDGTPVRTVRLIGQDAGKLLDMYRVMFMFLAAQGQNYLETFKLQAATGIEAQLLPVAEFYKQLITRAINPFIQKMAQFSASQIKPFQTDLIDDTVPGQVAPQLAASMDSVSIWHLMDMFADRPWNELFVEDQEDGPHVVFRQAPYKDYDGDALILQGAKDPGEVSIDSAEVVSSSLQRSDGRVANFYWVPPGMTQMDSAMLTTAAMLAQGYPIDLAHDANTPTIYGQRMMQAGTNLVPGDVAQPIVMLPKAAKDRAANATVTWAHARASQLMALNRDNVLFDEGSLVVMGRETLVAGKYLKLTRGDIESSMYIQSVAHQFLPLQGWSTHLRVIRGTGYRVRTTHPGQPWVVEGYRGPYS